MNDPRQMIHEMLCGRWKSQILYTGCKLGVFDALQDAPKKSSCLAEELSLNPTLTYRLLRALGCLDFVKEDQNKVFSLTNSGEYLCQDHPNSVRGMILLEGSPELCSAWKHLPELIKDGKQDGFRLEFKQPFFEYVSHDPELRSVFDNAMTSYSLEETNMVIEALTDHDFSAFSLLCDIGGGHGHLLCNLLVKYSDLKGKVYDLPEVIDHTNLSWAKQLHVNDRCEYVSGNMFKEVPPADAYFLKHILHDWSDNECVKILSNMHEAAEKGARTFVAECVIPGPDKSHFSKLFDIHMMCVTSGQERTEDEYESLFDQAGWKYVKTWYPASNSIGVVEAVKS